MSIVNLKIIFVKKPKQTPERPTQGLGATFIYNRNGLFSHKRRVIRLIIRVRLSNTSSFENGMAFILNEQSAWLYPSILTDSLKMDYPFQMDFSFLSLCTAAPSPQKRNRRRGVCGAEGVTVNKLVSDG